MKIFILTIAILLTGLAIILKYSFNFTIKTEIDILSVCTLAVNISLAYYISVYLSKKNQELRSQKDLILTSLRTFLDHLFAEKETLEKLANFQNQLYEAKRSELNLPELVAEKKVLMADIQKQVILSKNERNIWVNLIDSLDKTKHKKYINEIAELSHQLTDMYIGQNRRDYASVTDFDSWQAWMLENETSYNQIVRLTVQIMYHINAL